MLNCYFVIDIDDVDIELLIHNGCDSGNDEPSQRCWSTAADTFANAGKMLLQWILNPLACFFFLKISRFLFIYPYKFLLSFYRKFTPNSFFQLSD